MHGVISLRLKLPDQSRPKEIFLPQVCIITGCLPMLVDQQHIHVWVVNMMVRGCTWLNEVHPLWPHLQARLQPDGLQARRHEPVRRHASAL